MKFRTKSKHIILKAELKRKWDYKNINLYNSSGFDIYEFTGGEYNHKTVAAPKSGKNIFAERIANDPQSELCIFLPTYNEIYALYIGAQSEIETINSVGRPAIAFYGNSITQGAAASRSGNAFVNIVARELNNEVYNYSVSNGCRGITAAADIIGTLNLRAIVIDYTRNCPNMREFTKTYPAFYNRIRSFHKDTPVILMTALTFQFGELLVNYNKIVEETFESARLAGHRTFLLDQENAFTPYETDLKSIDGYHYTDHGMYRIAERIVEIIKNCERGKL